MNFSDDVFENIPELRDLGEVSYNAQTQEDLEEIPEVQIPVSEVAPSIEIIPQRRFLPWEDAEDAEIVEDSDDLEDASTVLGSNGTNENTEIEESSTSIVPPMPQERDTTHLEEEQYARFKGASWYDIVREQDVTILGLGGIGSWLSLLISRTGVKTLTLYDGDRFEVVNMAGQLCNTDSPGKYKVDVASQIAQSFSNYEVFPIASMFREDSEVSKVVLCGFDNMGARKLAFEAWLNANERGYDGNGLRNPAECLFIDGRLTAETFQIFLIEGNDQWAINKYKEEWLFSDDEATIEDCTFKQTSHMAAMIASYMTSYFTSWCNNLTPDNFPRLLPFMTSYNSILNSYHHEY